MYITTLRLKGTDQLLEESDGTKKVQGENLIEDENEDDAVGGEHGNEENEQESDEEDSQDLDTSECYSIGGKTSYAAFMDRLDDVCNLSCLYYNHSEIICIDLRFSSNVL